MTKKSTNAFKNYTDYGVLDVFKVPTKDMPEETVRILAKALRREPFPPAPVHNCNWCGETCVIPYGLDLVTQHDVHGLIDAEVTGGFASTPGNGHGALDDCSHYKFSLCEFCLDFLFSQFRTPPDETVNGTSYPFVSAHERVATDDWRGMKKEFYDEAKRRAQRRKP